MAVVTVPVMSGPASGDAWGDTQTVNIPGTGPHPDGSNANYCYGSTLPAHLEDNADKTMDDAVDESDANIVFHSTCDLSGGAQTDIVFGERDLNGTPVGLSGCSVWHSSGLRCDRNYADIDVAQIRVYADSSSTDALSRGFGYNKVMCHEAGHSVGLTHYTSPPDPHPVTGQNGEQDCMRSGLNQWIGASSISTATYHYYSDHHLDHLNDWF